MAKNLTEDAVRDLARDILGLVDSDIARAGVGQLTTFNQLGFPGVADKPDGWYLPENKAEVALVLETKATRIALGKAQVDEVLKNVRIMQTQYEKVIGVLYNGEDVMGIFFNEFNRYKKKSESGQIFTPEHITDFMYKILEVNMDDCILDATCGSGGFLVKAMANMIHEAGGMETKKAGEIKSKQLYGIEFDREIYALACANMLIHKDGKTNLEQMDTRSETACEWMQSKPITKVLMNPPYENKYGCMTIVENVLDSVPTHTQCAFILPDKKLEKASKAQMKRILKNHRLRKVIKLPEDLFFGVGVTTSIFVFEAGVAQDGKEFFACYMESDGLATVKNKGRHDVYGKWAAIEAHWVDVVEKQSGDDTCQWVDPAEHLSYQMPQKPFEIFEEDFRKTAMDYLMFQQGIDAKAFGEKLLDTAMYSSRVSADDDIVTVSMQKGGDGDGED